MSSHNDYTGEAASIMARRICGEITRATIFLGTIESNEIIDNETYEANIDNEPYESNIDNGGCNNYNFSKQKEIKYPEMKIGHIFLVHHSGSLSLCIIFNLSNLCCKKIPGYLLFLFSQIYWMCVCKKNNIISRAVRNHSLNTTSHPHLPFMCENYETLLVSVFPLKPLPLSYLFSRPQG